MSSTWTPPDSHTVIPPENAADIRRRQHDVIVMDGVEAVTVNQPGQHADDMAAYYSVTPDQADQGSEADQNNWADDYWIGDDPADEAPADDL